MPGKKGGSGTATKSAVDAVLETARRKPATKTKRVKIVDRETRAAKTPAHVQTKKQPPIPIPSLTIEGTTQKPSAKPKPFPYAIPLAKPKTPQARHLPTQYEYLPPQTYLERQLGRESAASREEWKARNQQRERARRDTRRAEIDARNARREAVRALSPEARKVVGREKLQHFIRTGEQIHDVTVPGAVGAIAKTIWKGLASDVDTFTSRLSAGARGRRAGLPEEYDTEDSKLFSAVGEIVVGPNVVRAARGDSFNPTWLAAELALLPIPLGKGLPTAMTAALRALVGTTRLRRATEESLTIAETVQTLTKSIAEVKAARRSRLVAEAAAGRRDYSSVGAKVTSDLLAKLAPESDSFVARALRGTAQLVRNDPGAMREFRVGESVAKTPYALSRSGKAAQRVLDKYRGANSTQRRLLQELVRRNDARAMRLQVMAADLSKKLPSGILGRVSWPEVYAARAVLKGIDIEKIIVQTERSLAKAMEEGKTLQTVALQHHLAYYRAAANLVEDTGTEVVFTDRASEGAHELVRAIREAGAEREQILIDELGLLTREEANGRVLNEQLYFHQGQLYPKDEVADKIKANPVYKQAVKDWRKVNPGMSDHAATVMYANARRYYEGQLALADQKIAHIETSLASDPETPMRGAWEKWVDELKGAKERLAPDAYFSRAIEGGILNELPPEILKEYEAEFGKHGLDWFFSLHEQHHPYVFSEKTIATNQKRRLNVTPLTWENERQLTTVKDAKRLEALDTEIDDYIAREVDREYQTLKADYDIAANTTKQRAPARALPRGTVAPRMRDGRVDIQRAGEMAVPVERTGAEYLGPRQSGRDLAEWSVVRRIQGATDGEDARIRGLMEESDSLRGAVERGAEPAWMRDPDAPLTAADIPIVGEITFDEMFARLQLFSTPETRANDAAWYEDIHNTLGSILTDREIMAWIDTQKGQGPAGGFIELSKIIRLVESGKPIPDNEISTTIKTVRAILQSDDPKLTSGARAKISDFFDSALGRDARTWMGGADPELYGHPMVIDRWSSRAHGVPESNDALGILAAKFGIEDVKATPIGEVQYERIAKRYEEFVDFVNAKGLDGRSDWTAREIQAMDWYATQRMWGNEPASLVESLDAASYRADFELTQGVTGIGNEVSDATVRAAAEQLRGDLVNLVNEVPGARVRRYDIDYSGWAGGGNPSVHMEVFGEQSAIREAITKIARATDQGLVQASRWKTVTKAEYGEPSKRALRVINDALTDPEVKSEFFKRLAAAHPAEFGEGGHMPLPLGRGVEGFASRTKLSNLGGPAQKQKWADKFLPTIRRIESEMGLPPSRVEADNLQLLIGSQHGIATSEDTTASVGGLALGDLSSREAAIRTQLVDAVRNPDIRLSLGGEGGVTDDVADAIVGIRGDEIAHLTPGWPQAVEMVKAGETPDAFLRHVTESGADLYDKYAIGRALDRVARAAGHPRISGRGTYKGAPGAEAWLPEKLTLGGSWIPDMQTMVFGEASRPIDYVHELMHANETEQMFPPDLRDAMYRFVDADPGTQRLSEQQAEDLVDMFEAMILGFDEGKSKLPREIQRAFVALREDFSKSGPRTKRAQAMLDKMPEEMRLRLEDTFYFEHAAEAARRTGTYTPEVQGLPFSFSETALGVRRYPVLLKRAWRGQRVNALTPTDRALEHSFTGALQEGGLFDRNVTKGPISGLLKAIELQKMHHLRRDVLGMATDIPTTIYDVAIPLDPKTFADEAKSELGALFRLFDVMESGVKVTEQELDKITLEGLEQAKDFFFPGLRPATARKVQGIAQQAMEDGAALARDLTEGTARSMAATPTPGVKWIDPNVLRQLGLNQKPGYARSVESQASRALLAGVDFSNNIAKAFTLAWNPAYYPMNMAGMGVMGLAQQGAFFPLTLARSLVLFRELGDDVHLIDSFAGHGLASILGSTRKGVLGRAVNASAKLSEILIDRYPRRAAFLYEARRLGYKSADQLRELMLNPANFDDLYAVSRRSNKAMVDFTGGSRFEREFMTRAIFVYPWLRASTRYAANFPLDHPLQTAAFAGLLYWQQERLKEQFPDGYPGYMKWYLPIKKATGGEPGQTPLGFRMDQLFTPLQTLDLAAEIAFWVAPGIGDNAFPWGSNEESLVTKLNPLYEEVAKTITGWDSFTQHEVSKSIGDMFRRMIDPRERWASWDRLKRVIDKKTHSGIYDTNQYQNWLRLFLGSLAPINVDPEEAARRAQPTKTIAVPDIPDDQKVEDFVQSYEEVVGPAPSQEARDKLAKARRAALAWDDAENEYKREHGIEGGGTTIQERLAILYLAYAKLRPDRAAEAEEKAARAEGLSDDEAQAAYDAGREALGLKAYDKATRRISEGKKEARVGG